LLACICLFVSPELIMAKQSWGDLPLYFIQNQGQIDSRSDYHLKLQNGNVFFEKQAITYQLISNDKAENIRIDILGANKDVQIEGMGPKSARMNFILGKNPDNWIEQAPTFSKLLYKNVYPQIDMLITADKGIIKHEYIVKKGGSVSDINLQYTGIKSLRVNDQGQLEIETSSRTLKEDTPFTFQTINGKRTPIASSYSISSSGSVGFTVGSYDPAHDLVIDPSLLYSTYLGSSGYDICTAIAVDLNLNAYVVGHTSANDFPTTPGVFDSTGDGRNVLLACINPTGTELIYATFFGGTGIDSGSDIAFSWGDKMAVIVGKTSSDDLPTTSNAYDNTLDGDSDAYIAKFRSNGKLAFATYFGGSDKEESSHVAVDGQGKIYLAGITASRDLPTSPGAYDNTFQETGELSYPVNNIFVAAFNSGGSSLLYSTYFGGIGMILGDIAVDFDGHAYITGTAPETGIPTTPGTYGETFTATYSDGFIARFNPTGTSLIFSSWLGTPPNPGYSEADSSDIDVDGQGNVYVIGTYYNVSTVAVAHRPDFAVFVKKYNSDASRKLWDKTISGNKADIGTSLVVDGRGGLYILGQTDSHDFDVTDDAFQSNRSGFMDLFIQKLKASNGNTLYSTYMGGTEWDWPKGIVTDSFGSVYITGSTSSYNFPTTPGAFQTNFNAEMDGFVARIRDGAPQGELSVLPQKITARIPKGSSQAKTKNIKVSNAGSGVVNYQVSADQSWLSVSSTKGNVRNEVDQIAVTIDPKSIKKAGTHKGVVRIASEDAFNSPQQVNVLMKIPGPKIKVSKKTYTLTQTVGGDNPTPLENRIKNSGKGRLRYKISAQVPWLSVTRKKGTSTGEWDSFQIKVNMSGLTVGIYSGTILVTSKDTVDTVSITVTLNINPQNEPY